MKRLRGFGAALALCLPLLAQASEIPGIKPNTLAPEAAGLVLQGPEGIKLSKLRGKVVVLDFWASWCGPCIQTMPELSALNDEMLREGYGDRYAMLGVSVDVNPELPKRFLQAHPVSYAIVNDQIGIASQTYGLWRLPATLLIKPDGMIHFIYWGASAGYTGGLKRQLLALLKDVKDAPVSAPPVPAKP